MDAKRDAIRREIANTAQFLIRTANRAETLADQAVADDIWAIYADLRAVEKALERSRYHSPDRALR